MMDHVRNYIIVFILQHWWSWDLSDSYFTTPTNACHISSFVYKKLILNGEPSAGLREVMHAKSAFDRGTMQFEADRDADTRR